MALGKSQLTLVFAGTLFVSQSLPPYVEARAVFTCSHRGLIQAIRALSHGTNLQSQDRSQGFFFCPLLSNAALLLQLNHPDLAQHVQRSGSPCMTEPASWT